MSSPVPTALYPLLTMVFLALGLLLTGAFFLYQVSSTRHSRVLLHELSLVSKPLIEQGFSVYGERAAPDQTFGGTFTLEFRICFEISPGSV